VQWALLPGQAASQGTALASGFQAGVATQIVNGGFESGDGVGWTEESLLGYDLVVIERDLPDGILPHGGSWAAWLGGDNGEVATLEQEVTVTAQASVLAYHHWIDSADTCGWDYARILVNGTEVEAYSLCLATSTGG
jgi:hypothetical protein